MTYQVKVEKKVLKFLQKHPQVQDSFFHAAMILENTGLSPLLDIKLLQGRKDRWRLRLWKWRFLFRIQEEQLIIYFYDAGARGDIYK